MKKSQKVLLIIIIILAIIAFIIYKFVLKDNNFKKEKQPDYSGIQAYVKDIYGTTFLIPEFDDINKADESWLWENVSQYVWNHDDEYHDKNEQQYGYTYDDISKIVKILYGNDLTKKFPTGAVAMRYFAYRDMYGPTSFEISNYYDYKIDKITQNGNIYTVSLYDYTISPKQSSENAEVTDSFKIFNNYDYILNSDNGTPVMEIKTLNDDEFKNILSEKDKLSHKILTIEKNDAENLYYIKSCKYEDTKDEEILASMYHKMEKTFEIDSIKYDQDDIYTQNEIKINNFDELASIYTENGKNIYKDEMPLFVYKDDGVYITAGDITVGEYLIKVEFNNIKKQNDTITCNALRTFRESWDPDDEGYNKTYQIEDEFSIVKQDEKWLIDKFCYTKYPEFND